MAAVLQPLQAEDTAPPRVRVLLADDDPVTQRLVRSLLSRWDYDVDVVADGHSAWEVISGPNPPEIALLDWMMPLVTGVELCQRLHNSPSRQRTYVILLTSRNSPDDAALGLDAGADDFVVKPFENRQFRARLRAATRIVQAHRALIRRVEVLQEITVHAAKTPGLIPICCYCKNVRDGHDHWQRIENYFEERSSIAFTHGICPECFDLEVKRVLEG